MPTRGDNFGTRIPELKLAKVAKEVTETLDRFMAWKKKIVTNPKILGGEPVFPKSRLSIRHIGALGRVTATKNSRAARWRHSISSGGATSSSEAASLQLITLDGARQGRTGTEGAKENIIGRRLRF